MNKANPFPALIAPHPLSFHSRSFIPLEVALVAKLGANLGKTF